MSSHWFLLLSSSPRVCVDHRQRRAWEAEGEEAGPPQDHIHPARGGHDPTAILPLSAGDPAPHASCAESAQILQFSSAFQPQNMRRRPGAACRPTGFRGGLAAVCREGRRPGQPSGCPPPARPPGRPVCVAVAGELLEPRSRGHLGTGRAPWAWPPGSAAPG